MRKILIAALVFFNCFFFFIFPQNKNSSEDAADKPEYFIPKNHQSDFAKLKKLLVKSFYKSNKDWRHIIDSTWGPGDPLPQKLLIFNTYAKAVHDEYDGIKSLNLNWDSLYNFYLNKINDSTSRGGFSAIMSRFAYSLKDLHTKAYDSTVVWTPLNPGVPVLLLGSYNTVEHFGAVTTILSDSTTLVLRVVPNHPLGLEPGDIILGYEGKPWKDLVRELLDAILPMAASTGGCESADTYLNLSCAGLNWHLFDTIDILKYSTGDTVHLSVLPLLNLNLPVMPNNEQLSIPNIPFPDVFSDQSATYGILQGTNIGYIFLAQEAYDSPVLNAEKEFYEAIYSLRNTDALIIDMRLNYGGWALFNDAFRILFNESLNTLGDAFRCSSNSFELCPSNNYSNYYIVGKPPKFYDRPIAVLLGPTCVSDGDITAQRLRYHPMVKFFGKSSDASLGFNTFIKNFPGWFLRYSITDAFHINNPGVYLNRKEFPIDFPVWHNKEDAAKGKDAVVEKALDWINNLVYCHNLNANNSFCRPGKDTLKFSVQIENPNLHQTSSLLYLNNSQGNLIDSLLLIKTGTSNKTETWNGSLVVPDYEDIFKISMSAGDVSYSKNFMSKDVMRFTTGGPVTVDSIKYDNSASGSVSIRPFLHNNGKTMTIKNVSVNITSKDPWVKAINPGEIILNDILPASTIGASTWCNVGFTDSEFPGHFNLNFKIMSEGWAYWTDSTNIIITGIREGAAQPLTYRLEQNYPNPFNPATEISYQLSAFSQVTLKVYDVLGREVATLVNEQKQAGKYEVEFNAASLPSGVYYYRITAGNFTDVKKMLLLK